MLEITLKQLEAFVCVADCGSFHEAAQQLFVSQPTLSAHIAALEGHFHTTLLTRGSRKKVQLTEAGQAIYLRARAILQSCRELEHDCTEQQELCLGASSIPLGYVLPPILAGFRRKYPGCRFELKKGDSTAVHRMLQSGSIQLGVVGTVLDREHLVYHRLALDHLVLVTPNTPEYQALQARGVYGSTLLDRPLIFRSAGSGTQITVDRYLSEHGFDSERLQVIARVETNEGVLELVAQQMGCSILSELAVQDAVHAGKVLQLPLEPEPVTRELYLVWPKHIPLPQLARQFIDFAKASAQ